MTLPVPQQPASKLGDRVFDQSDQLQFASLSGDFNPMHMDPVAARRLLSGRQVVHGMHTLLLALDRWSAAGGVPTGELQCDFANPVNVGDTVNFSATLEPHGGCTLVAQVAGQRCATIVLGGASAKSADLPAIKDDLEPHAEAQDYSGLEAALVREPGVWVGTRGSISLKPGDFETLFPSACRAFGRHRVQALAGLSYWVGMVSPGLHSIFSSVRAKWSADADATEPGLQFRVEKYDPRIRLLAMSFCGVLQGEIKAFVRPEPQLQPSTQDLLASVAADEFAGTHSIVIGGSRGLGELTAKLVAAGGGDVTITYATGKEDARRVQADIASAGRGRCWIRHHVVGEMAPDALADAVAPNAIFYFATPKIFRKSPLAFDAELFIEFTATYATEFASLCAWTESLHSTSPVRIFYPSSTAVAERPRGMTEYSMAKAAAEVLIEDLNRRMRKVHIICERLPRLSTDQTATLVGTRAAPNLDAMLPIVRRVVGAG